MTVSETRHLSPAACASTSTPGSPSKKDGSTKKQKRAEVREQLGLNGKLVLGHVGRFDYQKNHPYLIDIFAALCRLRQDAVLLLLGEGPAPEKLRGQPFGPLLNPCISGVRHRHSQSGREIVVGDLLI